MALISAINRQLRFAIVLPLPLMASLLVFGATQKQSPRDASASVREGVDLAMSGKCAAALDLFEKNLGHLPANDLKHQGGLAMARCAMSLNRSEAAVRALLMLRRDLPEDPEVLFITAHYYSELANEAAQELAHHSPNSPQAHQLQAEALESEGKWDEATAEYKKILKQQPDYPGIHYRLARILLLEPDAASHTEQAIQELKLELKVNPNNPSAEFTLGEIARRSGDWESAIGHFSRASQLDPGFAEAFLALGISLSSAGRYAAAIPPLEKYATIEPGDPAGHYQLAMAYSRTGRKQEAVRQLELRDQAQASGNHITLDQSSSGKTH